MFHSVLLGVQIAFFRPLADLDRGGGPYPLADLDRGSKSAGGPNPLWHRVNPSLVIVCARLLIQYGAWNCKKVHCSAPLFHFGILCNLFPKRQLLWGIFFNSSCWSFILRRNVLDKIWLINMVRMKLSSFWEISLLAKRILAWRETTNGNHAGVGGTMRLMWVCLSDILN